MTQQRFNVGDQAIYARPSERYAHRAGEVVTIEGVVNALNEYHIKFKDGTCFWASADCLNPAKPEFVIFDSTNHCRGWFSTLERAIAVAETLAKDSPGLFFTVAKSVAHVKAEQPTVTVTRL